MSGYAVRNDNKGWRAVNGPDQVGADEYFSETPVEIVLAEEQLIEKFRAIIQRHLDEAAVRVGYDDIKTAVTYADEPSVLKFQTEGKALRAWRSMVWAYGYEQIDAVKSGARALPTPEELIAELPPLVMP
jgi:hypothetical protein